MSQLFYSLIVREPDVVLAEHYTLQGTFPHIARNILPKLPRQGKFSYTYNSAYCFHYISQGNVLVLCLADGGFSRRVAFLCLEDLCARFMEKYGNVVGTVIAFGVAKEFNAVLKARLAYFNSGPTTDKLSLLKSNLDDIRSVMVDNIDKVLARGEKVELLVKKTETMSENAVQMRRRATDLRRKMWRRNVKTYLVCALATLVLVVMVAWYVCGLTMESC